MSPIWDYPLSLLRDYPLACANVATTYAESNCRDLHRFASVPWGLPPSVRRVSAETLKNSPLTCHDDICDNLQQSAADNMRIHPSRQSHHLPCRF